jgi:hypothetical protein
MKYAIDYRNMRNGIHGLLLYNTKSSANAMFCSLHNSKDDNGFNDMVEFACEFAHAVIEEVDYRELEEVMKDVNYSVNDNGRVHTLTSNVRIVNFNQSIDI